MEMIKLIQNSHKEEIGKYYLSKASTFAFNNEFGKAYEFFKEGLDILTCDCQSGWLNPSSVENKKVFDDINIKHTPHIEYYFVKAYIMSYEADRKNQYLALEAIDKYLEVKNDEYGNYVRGKIFIALNEPQKAFECFEKASLNSTNQRLLYRLGRTKEQLLEQNGLEELYYSFVQNPFSACCARNLKKYMKERGDILVFNENEINPLLIAFNNDEAEWQFQKLYEKLHKSQIDYNFDLSGADNAETINYFIQVIKNNSNLFVESDNLSEFEYDEEDYSDYEDRDYRDYDRDTFDALTDGQYGDYDDWRESGRDFDSLRDGLGY